MIRSISDQALASNWGGAFEKWQLAVDFFASPEPGRLRHFEEGKAHAGTRVWVFRGAFRGLSARWWRGNHRAAEGPCAYAGGVPEFMFNGIMINA